MSLGEEALGPPLATARQRCVVPQTPGIARGGAFPLDFPQGTVWVYGVTFVGQAEQGSSMATLPAGSDPCLGGRDVLDAQGLEVAAIPLTDDELRSNATRTDGRRIEIWPFSGYVSAAQAFVYFQKVLTRGLFDVVEVGRGVARMSFGAPAERTEPMAFAQEPTLLWLAPGPSFGAGAFVAPDGSAYSYGCSGKSAFDAACQVARVPADGADDPAAYAYYDGTQFQPEPLAAAVVLEDAPSPSVSWAPALGTFLAVYAPPLDDRVVARRAPSPWGPFGDEILLYDGTPPSSFWIGSVVQHPAAASGRTLVTSYFTSPDGGPAGMRLVEVTFR